MSNTYVTINGNKRLKLHTTAEITNKIKLHAIADNQTIPIFVSVSQPLGLAHFKSQKIPQAKSYIEKANGQFYLVAETVQEVWGAVNDAKGYFVEPYQEIKTLNHDGSVTKHKDKSNQSIFPTVDDDYILRKRNNL